MDMGGLPIRQPFPSAEADQIDPFLLLHHANVKVPTHIDVKHAGVGPHPHRGFSPVTFMFEGGVNHLDSRGNNQTIYAGGTQWMNAGMGVIHSERPPQDIHAIGGKQELIQLWINTPAKHKMDIPSYYPLTAADTPTIQSPDGLTTINIIAGNLSNINGPIKPLSDVNTFTANMKKGGRYFFAIPQTHNTFIYLLDGTVQVNGNESVLAYHAVVFNNNGEGFELEALEDTRLLIGSGEQLNEPVVSHGPFVMNTQTEIMEAFRDYQLGKMGVLIEE
jgi:redox-sensitive bicupin YhaK (pirin superfamily)